MAPVNAGAPAKWAGFIDALIDPVWLVDLHTLRIVAANAAAARLAGVPAAGLLGREVAEFAASPLDEALWDELRSDPSRHGPAESTAHETWVLSLDGQRHPVTQRMTVLPRGAGAGLVLVSLRPRELELALQQELENRVGELQATLESTTDGILVTDLAGTVQRFNRRFAELWQLPEALLTGSRDDATLKALLRSRVGDLAAWDRVQALWTGGPEAAVTVIVQLAEGGVLECMSHPLRSAGTTLGRVTSFRDLSERQRSQQTIDRLRDTDALTGLANRRVFSERLGQVLQSRFAAAGPVAGPVGASASGSSNAPGTAVLVLNLDRFRNINETLGGPGGDAVLVEAARRLQAGLQRDDIVARLGADEFAVALPTCDVRGAETVARKLLATMGAPFQHDSMRFTLTASIGITLVLQPGAAPDACLQEASAAMRRAKQAGRATFRFHQTRHDVDLRERLRIDQAMREGLPNGDFRLHVQPQVRLADGELAGVEALLRWRDPVLGEVPPGRFISMAEDSGFIVDLGQWVLEQACGLAADWLRDGRPVPIAVNVSALQFRQPDFVDRVGLALDRAGLPAALLELELTESILLEDAADAQRRLGELERLGVRIALDDFGTGYSSLAYLRDLPLHRLKLDRGFIAPLPDEKRQAAIVESVISMARAIGIEVVAEGVETRAQADFLKAAGCPLAQGFHFGRPMEPGHLASLFDDAAPLLRPLPAPPREGPLTRPSPLGAAQRNQRRPGRGLVLVKS